MAIRSEVNYNFVTEVELRHCLVNVLALQEVAAEPQVGTMCSIEINKNLLGHGYLTFAQIKTLVLPAN